MAKCSIESTVILKLNEREALFLRCLLGSPIESSFGIKPEEIVQYGETKIAHDLRCNIYEAINNTIKN